MSLNDVTMSVLYRCFGASHVPLEFTETVKVENAATLFADEMVVVTASTIGNLIARETLFEFISVQNSSRRKLADRPEYGASWELLMCEEDLEIRQAHWGVCFGERLTNCNSGARSAQSGGSQLAGYRWQRVISTIAHVRDCIAELVD